MSKETNASGIATEEMKIAYSGSAILSNKFYVTVGPVVRITFAEAHSLEEPPIFRVAAALSIHDAISLKNVLQQLLKEPEEQIAKVIEAQQKKGGANGGA
jgi:hypothetical protein